MRKQYLFYFGLIAMILLAGMVLAEPSGAGVTASTPQNWNGTSTVTAGNASAFAGNVTELILYGYSTTQSWQGFYGNISGTIQLADAANNVLYNWTGAIPQGEVYASINSTIAWANVQCFNFTANGSFGGEIGQGGTTNRAGLNKSQLESAFGISQSDGDGVDETFTLSGAGTHEAFTTASQSFSAGECRSTRVYDQTGQGVDNKFEEVLLYEPSSTSLIFTTLLEDAEQGFNNGYHDFEMLVLENGHSGNTAATPYYFFLELQ